LTEKNIGRSFIGVRDFFNIHKLGTVDDLLELDDQFLPLQGLNVGIEMRKVERK